jgi:preprotein translocase subunit SecY
MKHTILQDSSLVSRLLVTFACLLAVLLLMNIPLPYIDIELAQKVRLDIISVGCLGLKPFLAANMLLWVITLIMPSWRRRLNGHAYDAQFFTGITYGITFLVALLMGFDYASHIYDFLEPATPLSFFVVIILTIAGTFCYLGFSHVISRRGIGQGVSLIICAFAIRTILETTRMLISSSVVSTLTSLLYFLVVIGFIILLIVAAHARRPVNGVNVPLAVTGFFPVHIAAIACVLFTRLPPVPVLILLQVSVALAVFFIVNLLYLRHITRSIDQAAPGDPETQPVLCWEWALLWTVIVYMLAYGYRLFAVTESGGAYLMAQTLRAVPNLFVMVLTFITYYRYWQYRTWKPVYIHSDPAKIYACAAERMHAGRETVVMAREGWGEAYGLFAGPMAERVVLEKPCESELGE